MGDSREPWWHLLAKTDRDAGTCMSLHRHLEDAAAVADEWWAAAPRSVRARIGAAASEDCTRQDHAGRTLLAWLAAAHDIGKASPAFIARLAADPRGSHPFTTLPDEMTRLGLPVSSPPPDPRSAPHAIISQIALADWYAARFAPRSLRPAQMLAGVLGAHHGFPTDARTRDPVRNSDGIGDGPWVEARFALLDRLSTVTGAAAYHQEWLERPLPVGVQAELAGLVVLCDWLASDAARFPYDDHRTSAERARAAMASIRLPAPWRPEPPADAARLFAARFPRITSPASDFQRELVTVASTVARPPLIIVEAPTGSGKTEGALMAAEVLAARFGLGGVFVGLPTMATSDAMFGRVLEWLRHGATTGPSSVLLAHGKAELNDDFAGLLPTTAVSQIHGEEADDDARRRRREGEVATVASWLSGRRKGLLSSFVVGTVDQALLAAVRSKFVALRHVGLTGKVVVIDEVHAADRVMQVHLTTLLAWLGHATVPVILMSATLPPAVVDELGEAYERGVVGSRGLGATPRPGQLPAGYPRALVWDGAWWAVSAPPAPESRRHLHVEPLRRDLSDELTDRLRDGGVALVVRNTVGRAQETFKQLSKTLDCEVVLTHSRFLTCDRAKLERDLVTRLGPRGARPHRLVVVGTQVVEQSLDIDVDLLVTDLAPIDLLAQRIGRLHRHRHRDAGRPEPVRRPTVLVDGVDGWDGDDPALEAGARRVYDPALLLSSLSVLRPALGGAGLITPDEVPDLVGQAYAPDPPLPEAWKARWSAARAERDRQDALVRDRARSVGLPPDPARTKDLDGWSRGAVVDHDQQLAASVRDGEDSVEVVVVRRVGRELRTLGHLEGLAEREISTDYPPPDDLAEQVARCTLRLPHWLSTDAAVGELEQDGSPGWQLSPWLVGQLPLVLDEDHRRTLAAADLRYTPEMGLVITRLPTERT